MYGIGYQNQYGKGLLVSCRRSIKTCCQDGQNSESHVASSASLVTFGCSVKK